MKAVRSEHVRNNKQRPRCETDNNKLQQRVSQEQLESGLKVRTGQESRTNTHNGLQLNHSG